MASRFENNFESNLIINESAAILPRILPNFRTIRPGRIDTPRDLPRLQSSWGQHGAHQGPVCPRWDPCWPQEPCYWGYDKTSVRIMNTPKRQPEDRRDRRLVWGLELNLCWYLHPVHVRLTTPGDPPQMNLRGISFSQAKTTNVILC